MKMKKSAKTFSRNTFTFACSLALFSVLALGVIRLTLFNQEFMIKETKKADYVATITTEVNQSIEDLARASQIPLTQVKGTVTQDLTQKNIDSYIRGIYTNVPFTIKDGDLLTNQLKQRLATYAKDQEIDLSLAANQNASDQLQQAALGEFKRHIEIPYLLRFGQRVMSFEATLSLVLYISTVMVGLLIVGLLCLSGPWLHWRLRYLSYMFAGTGGLLIALPAYLLITRVVHKLGVSSESLYRFITSYVTDFIWCFVVFGGVSLSIGVILWFCSEFFRRKVVKL